MREIIKRVLFFLLGEDRARILYYSNSSEAKLIRQFGPEALRNFSKVALDNNVEYSLMFGTLLGSYREHTFIKHDLDVDIAVRKDCITPRLINDMIKSGFTFHEGLVANDNSRIHISFYYKNEDFKFDFYSYDIQDRFVQAFLPLPIDGDWEKTFKEKKAIVESIQLPFKSYKQIMFEGSNLNVFMNDEEVLRILYGDDFMTPKPGAKAKENSFIKDIPIDETWLDILNYDDTIKKLQIIQGE